MKGLPPSLNVLLSLSFNFFSVIRVIETTFDQCNSVTLGEDNTLLVAGCEDNTWSLIQYDIQTGALLQKGELDRKPGGMAYVAANVIALSNSTRCMLLGPFCSVVAQIICFTMSNGPAVLYFWKCFKTGLLRGKIWPRNISDFSVLFCSFRGIWFVAGDSFEKTLRDCPLDGRPGRLCTGSRGLLLWEDNSSQTSTVRTLLLTAYSEGTRKHDKDAAYLSE